MIEVIWFSRIMAVLLWIYFAVTIVRQDKENLELRNQIKKILDASMLIAVAASRDIREYDASPITEDRRKRGDDTSIMVVARVSVWREFIAAIKGE